VQKGEYALADREKEIRVIKKKEEITIERIRSLEL